MGDVMKKVGLLVAVLAALALAAAPSLTRPAHAQKSLIQGFFEDLGKGLSPKATPAKKAPAKKAAAKKAPAKKAPAKKK